MYELLACLKHNLAASTNPTATDDSSDGYGVGSRWLNTSNRREFVCADSTAAAAVWTVLTPSVIFNKTLGEDIGSDQTTWTIDWGGAGYKYLRVVFMGVVATGAPSFTVYLNNLTTSADYHNQHFNAANGGAVATGEAASMVLTNPLLHGYMDLDIVCDPSGRTYGTLRRMEIDGTDNLLILVAAWSYDGTAPASITQLIVSSSVASAIDTLSRVIVMAME